MKIRLLTPAQEEFLEAAAFYGREAQGLGSELIDEFDRALNLIASNPHLGPHFEGESRRELLRRLPSASLRNSLARGSAVVNAENVSRHAASVMVSRLVWGKGRG